MLDLSTVFSPFGHKVSGKDVGLEIKDKIVPSSNLGALGLGWPVFWSVPLVFLLASEQAISSICCYWNDHPWLDLEPPVANFGWTSISQVRQGSKQTQNYRMNCVGRHQDVTAHLCLYRE